MSEIASIQMGNQYNDVIMLDEYNGQVSVVAARESKDGKFFPQWVFPQDKDRQPREKAIPLKVTLGGYEDAARHLRYLADVLESKVDKDSEQEKYPEPDNSQFGNGDQGGADDEIPF